jgi:hypothetical protein
MFRMNGLPPSSEAVCSSDTSLIAHKTTCVTSQKKSLSHTYTSKQLFASSFDSTYPTSILQQTKITDQSTNSVVKDLPASVQNNLS